MGAVALIMFVAMMVGAAWFLLPFAVRKLAERRLARLCRKHKAIVLSYDDGPGARLTSGLLDALAERNVAATFFVLGRRAETHMDLVARTLREGHEVGSHSFHHSNAWKVPPGLAMRDMSRGIRTVRTLGGDARLFRPPYGKMTLGTLVLGLLQGQRFGWWTIDTKDTREAAGRRPVQEILAQIRSSGGGVVLAHDFDRDDGPPDSTSRNDYVLMLTRQIIEFAEDNGYRFMRLGDLKP